MGENKMIISQHISNTYMNVILSIAENKSNFFLKVACEAKKWSRKTVQQIFTYLDFSISLRFIQKDNLINFLELKFLYND